MDLQNIVKTLADVKPNGRPFVSLYLNLETDAVSRKESEQFLSERYRRLIKSDAQSLPIGKEANMIWRHIENYLAEDLSEGTRGVAIFARFQAEGDLSFHAHGRIVFNSKAGKNSRAYPGFAMMVIALSKVLLKQGSKRLV